MIQYWKWYILHGWIYNNRSFDCDSIERYVSSIFMMELSVERGNCIDTNEFQRIRNERSCGFLIRITFYGCFYWKERAMLRLTMSPTGSGIHQIRMFVVLSSNDVSVVCAVQIVFFFSLHAFLSKVMWNSKSVRNIIAIWRTKERKNVGNILGLALFCVW